MKPKYLLLLHLILLFYSIATVCAKKASFEDFLSFKFILFYGLMALILFLYAIFWQQILKKVPLVFAYANKAVTVIWGMLWGVVLFGEEITPQKIAGILIVLTGMVLYSKEVSDEQN